MQNIVIIISGIIVLVISCGISKVIVQMLKQDVLDNF